MATPAARLGATETGLSRQFFLDHGTDFAGNLVPVGYAVEDMTEIRILVMARPG